MVALILLAAPAAGASDRPSEREGEPWREITWDANADFTLGRTFPGPDEANFTTTVRIGAAVIHEPWFLYLGPIVAISNIDPPTAGVQVEVLHVWSGVWGQVAPLVDLDYRSGVQVAAGWSILGVDGQLRADRGGDLTWAVACKIRLPFHLLRFLAQ